MDIYEDWAMHIDDVGQALLPFHGRLKADRCRYYRRRAGSSKGRRDIGGGQVQKPTLEFYGYEDGIMVSKTIDCQMNGRKEVLVDPQIAMYNDNQVHWVSYLRGDLTDETRIDSPYIAMQTALLSEGIFLSQELNRSVTADEIRDLSKSTAVRVQETPWGKIEYDF